MPFQRQVNNLPAPAIAGDFASANPRASAVVSSLTNAAYVAGSSGCSVGRFAFSPDGFSLINTGTGLPVGFVGREQQALITAYLGEASNLIPPGLQITAYNWGDFWATASAASAAAILVGMKAYASYVDGSVSFNTTGTPPTGATATSATLAKIVSASTGGALPISNTCTGSIAGNVLTVSAVGSGSVLAGGVGQTITGTNIDPGTYILAQLTGTAGGIGTYSVSVSQTVASTAITLSGGGLTLTGANTTGVFAVGMGITGTNIPAGTTIIAYGTGTAGGAGTYLTNQAAATAATASTITASTAMYLTVDSSSTGTWALNDLLSGSGVASNQYIAATGLTNANLTGLGGAGTYLTSAYQSSALTAQTISVYSGVETKWYAQSSGVPGNLIIMSTVGPG